MPRGLYGKHWGVPTSYDFWLLGDEEESEEEESEEEESEEEESEEEESEEEESEEEEESDGCPPELDPDSDLVFRLLDEEDWSCAD